MKIGYACINNSIGCRANSVFRLRSYSRENLLEKAGNNIDCLMKILRWNVERKIFFFRISSETIPFASHSVIDVDWKKEFSAKLREIGDFVKNNGIRISMHPDQFVVINSPNDKVVFNSFKELEYHADIFESIGFDSSFKIQVHVGGAYGNKENAINSFIKNYSKLSDKVKSYLAIENDDKIFNLNDCLKINSVTGIPIIFDNLHHECLNEGESLRDAFISASKTWRPSDGIIMCDYSSQQKGERKGKHASSLDSEHFRSYLNELNGLDMDIMLEIKDKEVSALKALEIAKDKI
jgi:UV DNA damage endonuclease